MEKEKLRIDKYLWSIRLFKTRAAAATACDTGKVKCNDMQVKASKQVHTGEEFEVKTEHRRWKIRVKALLYNRLSASLAINFYEDITPPEEVERLQYQAASFHTGKRLSKIGRPTKKERRDLDNFIE